MLTPARQRNIEYLDAPDFQPAVRRRVHADIELSNLLFGGRRAVLAELDRVLPSLPQRATLLDVGTGGGDIPAQAIRAAGHGVELTAVGLDQAYELLATAERIPLAVCADGFALPFRDRAFDVVCCSQLLHHFEGQRALDLLREMQRVARGYVIVSDLRRSWVAVAGLWVASFVLGFHPVSRHDGVVSILRGFTRGELAALVQRAVGSAADVHRRLGFRVTATWAAAPD